MTSQKPQLNCWYHFYRINVSYIIISHYYENIYPDLYLTSDYKIKKFNKFPFKNQKMIMAHKETNIMGNK